MKKIGYRVVANNVDVSIENEVQLINEAEKEDVVWVNDTNAIDDNVKGLLFDAGVKVFVVWINSNIPLMAYKTTSKRRSKIINTSAGERYLKH